MNDTKQPLILDQPTIDALLAPDGAMVLRPDFFPRQYLAVEVELEKANDLRGGRGAAADDEIMEMKDEILRSLDTRLTKILKL